MGLISRLYNFVNGTPANADQVDDEINQILAEFNGNIDNNNIKANAGILFSKLADAPSGATTSKINDLAVTTAKIADLNVTTGKIADLGVTKAKIAAANVSKDKIITTGETVAFSYASGVSPVVATVAIVGTYPKATHDLLSLDLKNVAASSGTVLASLFADDAGANWVIKVVSICSVGGATVTGSAIILFIQKT